MFNVLNSSRIQIIYNEERFMSNQRLQYIDALRGIAIFLVILAHAFMFNGLSPVNEPESPLACFWYNATFYFHLPLFFFISGYFLSDTPQNLKNTSLQIWKKVRQLFIPFLVCSFLLALWKGYTYWFLKTLFCFFLLCYPLNYIRYKFKFSDRANIIVSSIYYVVVSVFGIVVSKMPVIGMIIDFRLEYFVFFILGYLNRKTDYMRYVTDELSLFFILIACAWCYAYNTIFHSIFVDYLVGFLLILVVWKVFSKMSENRFMKFLSWLGVNSIEIYILHFYFGYKIPMFGNYIIENLMSTDKNVVVTHLTLELIVISTLTLCMMILSIMSSKVIKSNKYISLLLFGRE